ncbi:HlyD family type I secretion periplasmic adaptor subunit [Alcaligenes nematophilus]|uniref:Membrane fusion protein (MFP) family protein n=3 Tax=Alcaligenes TaxID=507 RepID=A0AAE9KRP9_ALCFA|nr:MULTISPECIES: HlyD family type I secretion periplasmic adaptor subunit [Alcaligenes]MCM2559938.1 HlyD family type I secretion periplasmic adaptor subunit [Alcaligenes faecalis]MCM2622787.1 HlyD family type I secretion periplasmic adaptor subunit [Alcaligenes faecalis]MCR4144307.1 HlyD family type I secretion periplasmic adaptor subunit [Alcaligenes faecalis]MCX5473917.1 HlyD family type I secretion periplasmic adaptor subunit [Alcaligenes nematophilus]MCX5567426.1 HlyD family type I secreti
MLKNASWTARYQDVRGSTLLIWLTLLAISLLIVWASFASIDEVVRGEGKVVPSRQVQIVQSLDGGVVEEILVRPGQSVEAGEVLLRIDPTRASSSLGENEAESLSLMAKAARLEAIAADQPFDMPSEVLEKAPDLAEMERRVWQARTEELRSNISVAQEQLNQRQQELRETQANRDQAASSCGLTSQELQMTRPLLKSGAVSEVDLLRLQRDVARYCGEQKAATAQISRIQASIQEAQNRIGEVEITFRNQARTELAETRAKLASLEQGQRALADRVRLAEVRSPVRGTIKTLSANTVGGVVQPGKDILEIVPTDDTLLLEVRINPRDIGFLHSGQTAEVKFTAYDFAVYGGLPGVLEQTSADTITDEKGNSFYIAKVRTDTVYVGDDNRPILPGMVAEVHIMTGKRTVMQYLLKPILRARSNAFRER